MVTGLNIIGQNKALQDHWVKRVVAYIIDWIILVIISILLTLVLFPLWWFGGGVGTIFFGAGILLYALIALLYWVIQEGFMGGTVGKKIMGLRVVGTHGPVDVVKATIRNVSKIHWLLLLLDWVAGLATEGDPRQKFTDRFAGTTVVRTDPQAYVEEQFRQMATPPPHPVAPVGGFGQAPPQAWPGQQAPPPGSPPAQQAPPQPQQQWPGQPPPQGGAGWPQHQWNEQGQLVQQARFCAACGGPLVPRGDGRLVCSRCGTVY